MTDPIDRQAAIKAIHEEFDECLVWDESGQHIADEVESILTSLPSAQPELIRCQDCKFGLGNAHNVKCDKYYGMGGYDDFCSRAERKEDATD